jgi:putative acetyltransferase
MRGLRPAKIRIAARADGPDIAHIHERAIRILASSHYDSEAIDSWAAGIRAEIYDMDSPARDFLVAEIDGVTVGFASLNAETAHVETVFVEPEHSREGVGAQLLRELERHARRRGIRTLRVSSSLNAVSFYEAAGFEVVEGGFDLTRGGVPIACKRLVKTVILSREDGEESQKTIS